jgi:hypothetical protein
MSWERHFDEPIVLPSGRVLRTLRDAGDYISTLPKAEHEQPRWQTVMQLLMAVLDEGPTMLARIGLIHAIHRTKSRSTMQSGKMIGTRPCAEDGLCG